MAYERHNWLCGEKITAELLNNIEDGIEEALACCGGGGTEPETITVYMGEGVYGCFNGNKSDLHTPQEVIDFCESHKEQDGYDYYTTAVVVRTNSGQIFSTYGTRVANADTIEWTWQDDGYEHYFTLSSTGGNCGSWD